VIAGIPISSLREIFPKSKNIIRTMPNTPGSIGEGVTGWSTEKKINAKEIEEVESILEPLGSTVLVAERLIDAVTGVSGSGPAYVFKFVAALRDGGIQAGLDAEVSYKIAL
jgi:pyrroline-5-carboxylate reductase